MGQKSGLGSLESALAWRIVNVIDTYLLQEGSKPFLSGLFFTVAGINSNKINEGLTQVQKVPKDNQRIRPDQKWLVESTILSYSKTAEES